MIASVLLVAGIALVAAMPATVASFGWFAYAPLSGQMFLPGLVIQPWVAAGIALAAVGLLGIGLALILGIGMRVASVSGTLLLLLMYLAELPLVTNPIIDDHITMALTIIALTLLGAGSELGLGKAWKKIPFVQRNAWLV